MCTCARLVAAHIKSGMCSSESTLISEANSGCVRVCQSVCRDERGEPSTNGSAVDHRSTTATAPLLSQEKGHFQHYVPHHNDCISMWCMLT